VRLRADGLLHMAVLLMMSGICVDGEVPELLERINTVVAVVSELLLLLLLLLLLVLRWRVVLRTVGVVFRERWWGRGWRLELMALVRILISSLVFHNYALTIYIKTLFLLMVMLLLRWVLQLMLVWHIRGLRGGLRIILLGVVSLMLLLLLQLLLLLLLLLPLMMMMVMMMLLLLGLIKVHLR